MAFDASPSWSGFNYQGKVALYYALKCINSESVEKDFSNYNLMLEDNEDFEIVIDNKPISFHQVKAYNESSYSKYSDALLEITLELSKNLNVVGKIHTWKEINYKSDCYDLKSSIKSDIESILEEFKLSTEATSTIHKAASAVKGCSKTTLIIRNAFKKKSAEEIAHFLECILTEQNDALSRISAYKYDDENLFCDLNTINEKIKTQLSLALKNRSIPITESQLDRAFFHFLGMMDKYIIYRHEHKKSLIKAPIEFTNIINILNIDHENISKEYIAYKFKERFFFYIDHYMEDPDEEYQSPEPGFPCNLQEIRKILLSLTPYELWEHYRHFSPQINLQNNNIDDAFETNSEGIRYMLIRIFHEIDFNLAIHKPIKYKLLYRNTTPPYQYYLPTTITNSFRRITQIERQISLNPSIIEILYEVENLIYHGSIIHPISAIASRHTEAPVSQDLDHRSKRNEPLNIIHLIPLTDAKDQLLK